MSADQTPFEILSESTRLSVHSNVEAWGETERMRRIRREIRGIGLKAHSKQVQRQRENRDLFSLLIIVFAGTIALLTAGYVGAEEGCAWAKRDDPYSSVTQICARSPFGR